MASYNKVILMGNLTRDPEMRFTQANMAICKIGLAVNRRWLDKNTNEWKEEPTFIDVTIFGKRGEAFAKYHSKGKPAFIEGSLRLDNWQDKEGNKRSKLYVVADEWQFVSGGAPGGGGGGYSGGGEQRGGYSAAPQGGSAPQPASGGPSYDEGPGSDFLDADDTPF